MFCILMMVVVTKMYKERRKTFVSQSCLTLCGPMDCSPQGSSVHGIFFRQGYSSGLPFPSPGDLPNPGIEPMSLASPALTGGLFTTSATWEYQINKQVA